MFVIIITGKDNYGTSQGMDRITTTGSIDNTAHDESRKDIDNIVIAGITVAILSQYFLGD